MPNWVFHRLTITGPETERERFMAECFSPTPDNGTHFDFDKLIPQPEHIRDADCESLSLGETTITLLSDKEYHWCVENWGTKWNACDTKVAREGEAILLSFETAWATPVPIFNEVARRFPDLRIEGTFAKEAYQGGGNILCQNGNVEFEDKSEEIRRSYEAAMNDASARTDVQQPRKIIPDAHGPKIPF
jgi:hypothetical protein